MPKVNEFTSVFFDPNFFNVVQNNLSPKQSFPSYSALCKTLNLSPVSSPSTKQKQLDKWKLYFKFTQSGRIFTINKIYSENELVQNIISFLSDSSISDNTLSYLLLSFLYSYYVYSGQTIIPISNSALAMSLGFFNENFKHNNPKYPNSKVIHLGSVIECSLLNEQRRKKELTPIKYLINQDYKKQLDYQINKINSSSNLSDIVKEESIADLQQAYINHNPDCFKPSSFTLDIIQNFYSHSIPLINNRIKSILSFLENNNIINFSQVLIGVKLDSNNITSSQSYNFESSFLTYKEKNIYQSCETLALEEFSKKMNIKDKCGSLKLFSISDIMRSPLYKKRYDIILSRLIFKKLNFDFVYPVNLIYFSPLNVSIKIKSLAKKLSENNSNFSSIIFFNYLSRVNNLSATNNDNINNDNTNNAIINNFPSYKNLPLSLFNNYDLANHSPVQTYIYNFLVKENLIAKFPFSTFSPLTSEDYIDAFGFSPTIDSPSLYFNTSDDSSSLKPLPVPDSLPDIWLSAFNHSLNLTFLNDSINHIFEISKENDSGKEENKIYLDDSFIF